MLNKMLTIEFYRVEMPQSIDSTFEEVIDRVWSLPDDDRTLRLAEFPIRLQKCFNNSGLRKGDMTRIRMDDFPMKTSITGAETELELKEDEGLGEMAAFLYNTGLRVLALQRAFRGLRAPKMAYYFQQKDSMDELIEFEPILKVDALGRLKRMGAVRRYQIRVARDPNAATYSGEKGAETIIEMIREYHAPSIYIELSVGRGRKETMNVRKVFQSVKNFLGMRDSAELRVDKLRALGRQDEFGDIEPVDFLEDRLTKQIRVSCSERTIPFEKRLAAVEQAWEAALPEIRAMFSDK